MTETETALWIVFGVTFITSNVWAVRAGRLKMRVNMLEKENSILRSKQSNQKEQKCD